MAAKYYVISGSEGGHIGIYEYTEKELLKFLNEYLADAEADGFPLNVLTTLKNHNDPMYWGDSMLIIKGEIKVPKPEKTVKSWVI